MCKSELFFLPASAVKAHLNQAQTWVPGGEGSIYIYIYTQYKQSFGDTEKSGEPHGEETNTYQATGFATIPETRETGTVPVFFRRERQGLGHFFNWGSVATKKHPGSYNHQLPKDCHHLSWVDHA